MRFILIANNSKIQFDSYGHLYFIKKIKEQKCGPFGSIITDVVEAKNWNHPFLYHWILSFFNTGKLFSISKYINIFLDSIYCITIVLVIQTTAMNWELSFLAGTLYITCPMWFSRISMGPRLSSFSPRIISEIGVNFFLIVVLSPLPIFTKYSLAIILGTFVLLSSKFGLQAIIFLSIIISLTVSNYHILLLLLLSIISSVIITKGEFINILKDQYSHLKWYFLNNIKGKMAVSNRNSLTLIFKRKKDDNILSYFFKIILSLLAKNSFTGVILKLPILIVFAFFLFQYNSILTLELISASMVVVSAIILFILINIPIFLFLGEAERYLNHVSFFIVFFVASVSIETNNLFYAYSLISYGVFYFIIEFTLYDFILLKFGKNNLEKIDEQVIMFLKDYKPKTIVCYPFHAVGFWRIMYHTHHKLLYPITCKESFLKKYNSSYDDKYPFINLDKIDLMNSDFNLSLLIVDVSYDIKVLIENPNWILLKEFKNTYSIFCHIKSLNE